MPGLCLRLPTTRDIAAGQSTAANSTAPIETYQRKSAGPPVVLARGLLTRKPRAPGNWEHSLHPQQHSS